MNSRGTLEALLLASEMKLLDCFTYVSTVYCNTHVREVEEMVYPLPLDWKMLIKTAENFESHELEIYAKKILGNFPNTYTFTKNVAEQICVHFQDKIPIVIFRPSIGMSRDP